MTNEDKKSLIDWCTEAGMSPERIEVAVRCVEWMDSVIEYHTPITEEPPFGHSEKAIENARFILECIDYYISI